MIRKSIYVVLLLLVILLLVMIGGSFYLLGTDSGFRLTTSKLKEYVPGLSIATTTGNLESGVTTDVLSWHQNGLEIDIHGFESSWSSVCLLQYRYCLDKLAVDTLTIKTRSESGATNASATPLQLPQISLPVAIEANEITIEQLVLDLSENSAPIVVKDIKLKASMTGSKLDVEWLVADYEQFSAQLSGTVKLKDDYALQGKLVGTAHGVIDNQNIYLDLDLNQSLRDLKIDGTVSGAIDLNVAGTAQALDSTLPLNMTFDWASLGWPLSNPVLVETRNANLTLKGTLDDYAVNYRSALTGKDVPDSDIELSGVVNRERILLPGINLLTLGGYATGSAALDWSDTITWVADLISKEINPGVKWEDMQGNLNMLMQANGTVVGGKWTLHVPRIEMAGKFRNFPLNLDGQVSRAASSLWQVDKLALAIGPNTLDLKGSYGQELDVETVVDFPAIHYLTPKIAGNVKGKANITGNLQQPSVIVSATSSLLRAGQILLRDIKLNSQLKEAAFGQSKLNFVARKLNANGQLFQNLTLNLDGNRAAHAISAFVDAPSRSSVKLNATGSLSDTFDWSGELASATVELPANTFTLLNKTGLAWNQDSARFRVDPHCWGMRDARFCLQNTLNAGADVKAELSLSNYSLEYLNPFLPATAQLSGKMDAKTELDWRPDEEQAFNAALNSSITNGKVTVTDENLRQHVFEYRTLSLQAKADPFTVASDLSINSQDMGNGKVSLTLNPWNEEKSIAGDVSLSGFNIGFLQAFMPEFDAVGGELTVRGKLGGNLAAPIFDGRVSLQQPVFRSPTLPLSIDGGEVSAIVKGERATLDGKVNSGEGFIQVGGNASWQNGKPQALVLLNGESLSIVQSPLIQSSVFPKLQLRVSPGKLLISGKVRIPSAVIDIKDLPEGTTSLSQDVVIIEEESLQTPGIPEPSLAIRLDIDMSLGEKVQLSGYGIDARLQGDFSVAKADDRPLQLNGEVRVVEGFYKSYGQDLSIKEGQILFVGPIERTTLDIDAVRAIDTENPTREAGLHLEGPIADPVVTLFTTPADKSPESILSYIVLGRDLGANNSASESNLLASAALALTLKQGNGYATGFAESLGISDFALEADGSGDETQVVVSGRLSNRLLLRYGRSVFSNEDTLFLRYDISRKLYLEAAQGLQRAVDVFYSFSF